MNWHSHRSRPIVRLSLAVLGTLAVALTASIGVQGQQAPRRPAAVAAAPAAPPIYFPDRFNWQNRKAEDVGMDSAALDDAAKYSIAHENPASKDLALDHAIMFAKEPFNEIAGPMKPRGALSGLVVRRGYVVAEWGDTRRVDMTFSATKTFVSTVVGLAWQRGLIGNLNDRVRDYLPTTELFDSPHNAPITWDHLLRQTSDWSGTLWGKPDWADRPEGEKPSDYPNRKLWEPGTHYKYNDVRVNLLAFMATMVLRRPLPEVLRDELMEPIGASNTWHWHGYDNAWIEIDGRKVQSVSGGAHWGAGMFISARDMARFGYLFLRNGKWKDKQIISDKWIAMARTPGTANPNYGFCNWFLNTGRKPLPSAPESSVTFRGSGANVIYMDWENDLVVVVRWISGGDSLNTFIGKVLASIKTPA